MASILLLTPEQARCNKELFQRAPAKLPPTRAEPSTAQLFNQPVSAENTAGTLSVSNGTVKSGYPPPPNSTIFSDEKYHENVISTFFSTAMVSVGYVPNSPTTPAEEEAKGFDSFLRELTNYGAYLSLEKSQRDSYEHNSVDCAPLLKTISGFIESVESIMGASNAKEVADGLTNMIQSAIESLGSSSSEKVSKTLYSVYRINGDAIGKPYPVATIFWSSVNMETHTSGKSTVQRQKVEMMSYSYMILSPIVVANANALAAATPVSVSQLVDSINANVPS